MKVKLSKEVLKILTSFEKKNYKIYIVGGAVRDILMKRMVDDWDFATNATPEEILEIFPDGVYDNAFGTVMLSNDITPNPFDITTFRTEHGYSDVRRPDKVEWGETLEEDLKRRDFTINAMAFEKTKTNEFKLVDPFDGKKDLKKKLIRAVGNADDRFTEDALRMMRAVRIASELNFKIEEKTKIAINKNASLITKIARERIKDELIKILASSNPHSGMETFREVGLMQEVLPEMEKTFGVEQKSPGRHHIYDVGTHSMLSLKHVSEKTKDPIVRLATLLHDVGKAQTYKKLDTGVITFYNHELVSAKIAKRIAERLRLSKKQSERLYLLVRYHQFTVDERQTDSAIRRFIRKVGKENIKDMLDLRVGDRLGGGARETSWRLEEFKKRLIEVQKQPFTVHDLKISGHDVMKELGIKPGPKVGEILDSLFEKVVDKEIANSKKALIKQLRKTTN